MDYWHIINRGVDKRTVFKEGKDFLRFIRSMYFFNDSKYMDSTTQRDIRSGKTTLLCDRNMLVNIHTYCLMKNHYHMFLSAVDNEKSNISLFMKKLNKGYSQAFNKKYNRSGALWQSKYKKIHINSDAHFQHIPTYIHCNPLDEWAPEWRQGQLNDPGHAFEKLRSYRWSSFQDYIGIKNFPSVLHTLDIPLTKTKHELLKKLGNRSMFEMHKISHSK